MKLNHYLTCLLLLLLFSITKAQTLNFSINRTSAPAGDTLILTNSSTGFSGSQEFVWNFGVICSESDGIPIYTGCEASSYGTGTLPYIYSTPGIYSIVLRYRLSGGGLSAAADTQYVTITRGGSIPDPPPCDIISNGNFEIIDACPSDFSQVSLAAPWQQGLATSLNGQVITHAGTSDLLNTCSTSINLDVPANFAGNEAAQNGNGYIGLYGLIVNTGNPLLNYSEYVTIDLQSYLGPNFQQTYFGETFTLTYFVSLADKSSLATTVDAVFSPTPIAFTPGNNNPSQTLDAGTLQRVSFGGNITNPTGWTAVTGTITINNTTRFLTIGKFNYVGAPTPVVSTPNPSPIFPGISAAYYYIDNVSLVRSNSCCVPTASLNYLIGSNTGITNSSTLIGFTGSTPTNLVFEIDGTFTIDPGTNLTFSACTLNMKPNARINVGSNCTLTFQNNGANPSVIRAVPGCTQMWDGIYLTTANSSLNISSTGTPPPYYTYISDAINGLNFSNGALFKIEKAYFDKNYKNMTINPFTTGVYGGTIRNSFFTTDPNLMLLPYYDIGTLYGIYTDNINWIMGDGNTFENMCFGVAAKNSVLTVSGNTFRTMDANFPFPGGAWPDDRKNIGISCFGDGTGSFPNQLTANGNLFLTCDKGIDTQGRYRLTVGTSTLNTFRALTYGVYVFNNTTTNPVSDPNVLNVSNNNFENSIINAVYMNQIHGSAVTIGTNNINNTGTITTNTQRGIELILNNSPYGSVLVNNNIIRKAFTGIRFLDIDGTNLAASPRPTIRDNDYTSAFSATTNQRGISVESSSLVYVLRNNIRRSSGNPTSAHISTARGISAENSDNITLELNSCRLFGSGIYLSQNMAGTIYSSGSRKVICNTLRSNWHHIYFNAVTNLGNQGANPGNITGNLVGADPGYTPGNSLAGTTVPPAVSPAITWIRNNYQTTGGVLPLLHVSTLNNIGSVTVTTTGTTTDPCGGAYQFARTAGEEAELPEITPNVPIDSFATNYNLYKSMFTDVVIVASDDDLTAQEDTALNQMLDMLQTNNSDLGLVYQAKMAADTGNVEDAVLTIDAINSPYEQEQLYKTVYGIYLNTWAQNNFALSGADSLTLTDIALQDPVNGTDAVYLARAMMNIYPEGMLQERLADDEGNSPATVYLYPNPATNQLNLLFDFETDAIVEVYNLQGQCVAKQQILAGSQNPEINISNFNNGIYLVRVSNATQTLINERLLIAK